MASMDRQPVQITLQVDRIKEIDSDSHTDKIAREKRQDYSVFGKRAMSMHLYSSLKWPCSLYYISYTIKTVTVNIGDITIAWWND